MTIAAVGRFRHSPFTGANDEKSGFVWAVTPGGERARVLTRGYFLSSFQDFKFVACARVRISQKQGKELIEDWT